jgi:DNA-binding MarR family transcriptional regulator
MTPARFDILFLIAQRAVSGGAKSLADVSISLGEIIIKVGFRKSTTARTVRHMEDVGFVRRVRDEFDRRQTLVFMTELGLRAFQTALQLFRRPDSFVVERIRYWVGIIAGDESDATRALYSSFMRLLARIFDQWAYPIYVPGFDPRAEYRMRWGRPLPFSTAPVLEAVPA